MLQRSPNILKKQRKIQKNPEIVLRIIIKLIHYRIRYSLFTKRDTTRSSSITNPYNSFVTWTKSDIEERSKPSILHDITSKDLKDDEKKRNTQKRGIEANVRERLERLHVHCLLFVFGDKQAKQISRATKMNRRGWEPHLVSSSHLP